MSGDPRPASTGDGDPQRVVIKVRDDGPYKVTGPVDLVDADGNRFPVEPGRSIALCRCGRSREKPFCDRSHRESGFSACERAGPAADALRDSGRL